MRRAAIGIFMNLQFTLLGANRFECVEFVVVSTEKVIRALVMQLSNPLFRTPIPTDPGESRRWWSRAIRCILSGVNDSEVCLPIVERVSVNMIDDCSVPMLKMEHGSVKRRLNRTPIFDGAGDDVTSIRKAPASIKNQREHRLINHCFSDSLAVSIRQDDECNISLNPNLIDAPLLGPLRLRIGTEPLKVTSATPGTLLLHSLATIKAVTTVVDILSGHGLNLQTGLMKCRAEGVTSTARHSRFTPQLSHRRGSLALSGQRRTRRGGKGRRQRWRWNDSKSN